MSQPTHHSRWIAGLGCFFASVVQATVPAHACTIFVLANADRVLFCNNEDCKNSHARVWFVPAAKNRLGCVYVGLRNQWAQGGMNTIGLACDGVAGISLDGVTNASPAPVQPKMKRVRGNPSERMLESCGSVGEAIAFYQSHHEPTFSYATIMLEAELERRPKGDAEKVEIAWRLRRETTMTLKWIARRMKMGVWTHVSNCLVHKRQEEKSVNS